MFTAECNFCKVTGFKPETSQKLTSLRMFSWEFSEKFWNNYFSEQLAKAASSCEK